MAHDLPRLAVGSSIGGEATHTLHHTQDVHSRLKNAQSQRNKRLLICSEGEPTLLSIDTRTEIEIATSLPLPRRGVEQLLVARWRAEQV